MHIYLLYFWGTPKWYSGTLVVIPVNSWSKDGSMLGFKKRMWYCVGPAMQTTKATLSMLWDMRVISGFAQETAWCQG